MAFFDPTVWNRFTVLFACSYVLCIALPIVDIDHHAFIFAFYKAVPVWMSSILSMTAHDTMLAIALIFGSVGDILLQVRHADTFQHNKESGKNLFKIGAGSFLVQHIIIILQFVRYWKAFRTWSLFVYFATFNVIYFFVLPNIAADMESIVFVYSAVLTSTAFLAINGLSTDKALKHEQLSCYATLLFLFSDSLVITEVFEQPMDAVDPTLIRVIVMLTYYSAQILFANASYYRYRHNRSIRKRKRK